MSKLLSHIAEFIEETIETMEVNGITPRPDAYKLLAEVQDTLNNEFGFVYENVSEEFRQRFAKLLIKECGILAGMYNYEKAKGTIDPMITTEYDFITKHFGIEE